VKKFLIIAVLIFLLIVFLAVGPGLYLDWLWFAKLGYAHVFKTVLLSSWAVRLLAWFFFALFLFINLSYTQKAVLNMPNLVLRYLLMNSYFGNLLTKKRLTAASVLISLIISLLAGAVYGNYWLAVRLFFAGGDTGTSDPVFGRDIAFYFFSLPFYELVYHYLFAMLVIAAVLCGLVYLFIQPPQQLGLRALFARRGTSHISLLLGGIFLLRAFGYRLQMFNLLYSPGGVVYGPGYTDIHVRLPAYWVLLFLSLSIAVVFLLNTRMFRVSLLIGGVGVLVIASVILSGIAPAVVQKFIVEPNEFAREEPYLEYSIDSTQRAFGLSGVATSDFKLTDLLPYEELLANEGTIKNIRLWDWRPLGRTFTQLQGLRDYYNFNDVDTDRYVIDGEKRQVMISARELLVSELPSPTWVNVRLSYTHGYGAVACPVTEVTEQGLPRLVLKDFPVQGSGGLQIDLPQIYYGELTDYYIFTNTNTDEFDYPMGQTNAFTRYEGTGGIPLKNTLRRALYALRFRDYRILVSGELSPESRIHYNRDILTRVKEIFPFLHYDNDPYPVAVGGRIFWLIDAYTTSNLYPYSQPYGGINYIRNSVKVTVDAYNGDVTYYVFAEDDPVINAYRRIFPGTFLPAEKMPAALKEHVRYPEYLFALQAEVYATYHMENSKVFYNKEDRWQIPLETYGDQTVAMEPYYTILRLPQEKEEEFVIMLPFTMYNRNNMTAWLAARCDGENYGQLIAYTFPKGQLLYGPAQIEARIDQDPEISQQLTLWSQRGSSVIRGNLLVLPVDGSILYVEPLYLEAQQSQLPELTRVIVAYGDQVVMKETLAEALAAVFGLQPGAPPQKEEGREPEPGPGDSDEVWQLVNRAAALYEEAQAALKEGDWAEYGRLQDELGSILARLQELAVDKSGLPAAEEQATPQQFP
jgi:uncharacterized membrane protein (UPF0182 family)